MLSPQTTWKHRKGPWWWPKVQGLILIDPPRVAGRFKSQKATSHPYLCPIWSLDQKKGWHSRLFSYHILKTLRPMCNRSWSECLALSRSKRGPIFSHERWKQKADGFWGFYGSLLDNVRKDWGSDKTIGIVWEPLVTTIAGKTTATIDCIPSCATKPK